MTSASFFLKAAGFNDRRVYNLIERLKAVANNQPALSVLFIDLIAHVLMKQYRKPYCSHGWQSTVDKYKAPFGPLLEGASRLQPRLTEAGTRAYSRTAEAVANKTRLAKPAFQNDALTLKYSD